MRKPARGIFLIDSLGSGGAQRQLIELVTSLDRHLILPSVVTYHDLPFFERHLLDAGIEYTCFAKQDKLGLSFFTKWTKFLKEKRPDFVHSYLNIPNLYARLSKVSTEVRTVITSERSTLLRDSKTWRVLEKAFWPLSDRIIANAWGIEEMLRTEVGIPAERITVIHNGISIERFSRPTPERVAQIRMNSGLSQEHGTLIGLIGRILKVKNQLGLLQALAILKQKRPSLPIFVGFWGLEPDQAYAAQVHSAVAALGLQGLVTFFEPEEDMASVYAACDIIVSPSLWEGFPNVVLEAMAAGRPVIASDIVDNAHIIDNETNGFLVRAGDIAHLSQSIENVTQLSKEARRLIGVRAKERACTSFSSHQMVQSTISVYQELGIC